MSAGSNGPLGHFGSVDFMSLPGGGVFPGFGGAPPDVAGVGSAGVALTASRSDHTHGGVTSINGLTGIVVIPGATFGGAPPKVATASAAGVAGTSSRSDHTHGLDILPYAPSAVGMQANGVFQQTFAAGTATPALLTMTASNVPFGAANGTLTQSAGITYIETTTAQLNLQGSSAGQIRLLGVAGGTSSYVFRNVTTSSSYAQWQGTPGAAGTSNTLRLAFTALVGGDTTDRIDWTVAGVGQSVMGLWANAVGLDFWAGSNAPLATSATGGFVWLPTVLGAPSGVPALAAASQGGRNPVVIDNNEASGIGRFYVRNQASGAWHYTTLDDYYATATRVPFGGTTAGTLTDSANLTFTVGTGILQSPLVVTNTVGGFGGGNTLTLENNHATPTSTINLTGSTVVVAATNDGLTVSGAGNTMLGRNAATAVGATDGFPFMPALSGAPTGAITFPFTSGAGFAYDKTNAGLWIKGSGALAWALIPVAQNIGPGAQALEIDNGPAGIGSVAAKWETYVDAAGVTSYRAYWQ